MPKRKPKYHACEACRQSPPSECCDRLRERTLNARIRDARRYTPERRDSLVAHARRRREAARTPPKTPARDAMEGL